eukprot:gene19312-21236_t
MSRDKIVSSSKESRSRLKEKKEDWHRNYRSEPEDKLSKGRLNLSMPHELHHQSQSDKRPSDVGREREQPRISRDTNKNDPESIRSRIFIGNLNTEEVTRDDIEREFSKYGDVVGCSLHTNFGFVQYDSREEADLAVKEVHGKIFFGKRVDANIANERRRPSGKSKKKRSLFSQEITSMTKKKGMIFL